MTFQASQLAQYVGTSPFGCYERRLRLKWSTIAFTAFQASQLAESVGTSPVGCSLRRSGMNNSLYPDL
ncbi:hypothetical protein JTE90_010702 [Oedothorax gibbosus]|uniref:Uncharacterized protein n=1 Tax=Oedothorax gibbosus TaxID=931172 RepID=A0AAV6UQP0_9ARAC|nr:hypothetical protein JTE90_010702 [Oedothorax gibbosus]